VNWGRCFDGELPNSINFIYRRVIDKNEGKSKINWKIFSGVACYRWRSRNQVNVGNVVCKTLTDFCRHQKYLPYFCFGRKNSNFAMSDDSNFCIPGEMDATPSYEELDNYYQALESGKLFELNWKSLGRRSPSPIPKEETVKPDTTEKDT
jgi:hypothetical protein